ncbi:Gfo/Idh/MocA family protein [Parabacteroides sp. AM08-6]|uniref:Gfo/Idh/MocA family protein n=1 Tax=Parabacteroides sp. AM08-6 TaxID=2292053 RepID=UPI000F003D14|nr:Gfo/Idh/MocA family oxidoreductase [Parabacteroides sp. AM08-6]RHJ86709.1 gfo/Idh/MocA family oxidoreductase [Parabacteroides sp. AM08-6]
MTNRREFIKKAAASGIGLSIGGLSFGATSAKSYANIVGANEKINMAVMGTNGRGAGMAKQFAKQKNVDVIIVCDVEEKALAKGVKNVEEAGGHPKTEKDIRKVLENKDVDGLLITAPDHWHAPATIMACQAGKHVYCEKPCSHNPHEGELSIKAARKYNRIVQVGAQRRSWPVLMEGIQKLHEGIIGRVYMAKSWYTNNRGSIGFGKQISVPTTLDFDLWQGPAPRKAYKSNLIHYNWHWFWHWGTGEALNNGTHEIDVIRWGLGVDYPTYVSSEGGRYRFMDDWETPDTQLINIKFGNNCLVTWEGRSCNSANSEGRDRGVIFYGENGMMDTGGNSYRIFDQKNKLVEEKTSKDIIDGRDPSSPSANLDAVHIADFLDAIRNGSKPHGDIEELHKSTLLVQLGNIAWRTGHRLNIDPSNGHIINDPEAEHLWSRTYEPGWELSKYL